jgi:hypothetical protein
MPTSNACRCYVLPKPSYVYFWPIVLQKSFCGIGFKFSEP